MNSVNMEFLGQWSSVSRFFLKNLFKNYNVFYLTRWLSKGSSKSSFILLSKSIFKRQKSFKFFSALSFQTIRFLLLEFLITSIFKTNCFLVSSFLGLIWKTVKVNSKRYSSRSDFCVKIYFQLTFVPETLMRSH